MIILPRNKVAIEPIYDPDRIGHIWIPEMAKERCDQGIVKYIGPGVHNVKPFDHVIFSGYTGTNIEIDGEGILILMPESYIEAVVEYQPCDVPGLYFRSKDGEYFTATYEQAAFLCARAIEGVNRVKPSIKPKFYAETRRDKIDVIVCDFCLKETETRSKSIGGRNWEICEACYKEIVQWNS